jgi:hypothetical protein
MKGNGPKKMKKQRMKSSQEWVEYFQRNAENQRTINWKTGAGISAAELGSIAASLKAWQLGETSDGSHLMAAATNYASKVGDPDFVNAIRLFIFEEQRHGSNLGRFLDLAGVERTQSNWGDTLFRMIRYSIPSMEVWVTPVVMVETHAIIYFEALRRASRSTVLRQVCEQILADEVVHILFQCERLAILHKRRAAWLLMLTMVLHRIMFAGITLAVWAGHKKALRAGGFDFPRFWSGAWAKMRHAWRMMAPKQYEWDKVTTAVRSLEVISRAV